MPHIDSHPLQDFADEIFELSKAVWATQSRTRPREQAEITETEFLALDLLAKADRTLNVGEIHRSIGILPAQMSRTVRALESKPQPLITCRINPDDKRRIDVELTPAGRKAHQSYRQLKVGSIQKMLDSLTTADRDDLMRILRKIGEGLHKLPK